MATAAIGGMKLFPGMLRCLFGALGWVGGARLQKQNCEACQGNGHTVHGLKLNNRLKSW